MKNDLFQPRILHEFISKDAEIFPTKDALIFENRKLTYEQLEVQSTKLANALVELGLNRHDRVIIFLENSIESVISILGILKAGAAFVVLNPMIKSSKLEYIINDSGASVIISQMKKKDIVESATKRITHEIKSIWVNNESNGNHKISSPYFTWEDLIVSASTLPSNRLSNRLEQIIDYDLAALIYTSGSTGEPKGVISSHFNMISAARSIIEYLENNPNDKILNVLPLSFDYGLYQVLMSIMFGGTIYLETSFMFPVKILELIKKAEITGFPIVPTIVALLLNMKDIKKYNLESLRYISNTGAALPVSHIKKFNELFPHVNIYSMFGLTECKRIAYLPPDEIYKRPSSVGKAMPNCEVFILDENGNKVSSGEIGELVVRGSNVMRGYWNSKELTERVYKRGIMQGEKLLYTGDLFRQDEDGYLYFIGRMDDMIKSKGERISPKEIENILCSMNEISEAAVIGVPDDIFGQVIKAFIVRKNNSELSSNDILKYCSDNMEAFMVPKYVEFLTELPKNPNGKIDKKSLKLELKNS